MRSRSSASPARRARPCSRLFPCSGGSGGRASRARGLGIDPVLGVRGGSVLGGLVLGLLSLRGRDRDSAIGAVLAFGLGVGVLFLSLYQGYATEATNLLFGSIG